jgi:hypothetical protein
MPPFESLKYIFGMAHFLFTDIRTRTALHLLRRAAVAVSGEQRAWRGETRSPAVSKRGGVQAAILGYRVSGVGGGHGVGKRGEEKGHELTFPSIYLSKGIRKLAPTILS